MLYRYSFVIIACIALLIGMQAPHFLTQYQQRLNAHLTEVQANLAGFQMIADTYFDGDLEALIAHHVQAEDPIFKEEAVALRSMYQRQQRFLSQQQALQVSYPKQLWHLLVHADHELRQATIAQYSLAVPLSMQALATGAIFMLAVLMLVDLLKVLLLRLVGRRPRNAYKQG